MKDRAGQLQSKRLQSAGEISATEEEVAEQQSLETQCLNLVTADTPCSLQMEWTAAMEQQDYGYMVRFPVHLERGAAVK